MSGTGQIAELGAQVALNHINGLVTPHVGSTPPTYLPGLYWIDTSSGNAVKGSPDGGTTWTVSTGARYLALLTADPQALPAVHLSDLAEVLTAGYARAAVTMSAASAAYPSFAANSALVTFGPFTADMLTAAVAVALVSAASGTTGSLLYTWEMPPPPDGMTSWKVSASQSIQIPTGNLGTGAGLIMDFS